MNERQRNDALLLDALGGGAPAPAGDDVATMLAAWRGDLSEGLPEHHVVRDAVPAPVRVRRRWSRSRSLRLALVGAVVAALGGFGVAAAEASPGSPLWPITRVINPGRAEVLPVQQLLDRARRDIEQQRYAEAKPLLDRAGRLIPKVRDPQDRQRLLAQWQALLALLPTAPTPAVPTTAPSGGPTTGPSPTAGPTGGAGGGGAPTGAPTTKAPGLPLPSLPGPTLPIPSLPVPTLPLPSLPLPSLPIPGI